MPPPLPVESDAESAAEDIPPTKAEATTKEEPEDSKMKDEEDEEEVVEDENDEEEEDEDEEDPETFVVEAILDHRSDFEDGQMRYYVKWMGYPKKADCTWETEENLEGAREILEGYWKTLAGKPVADQKPSKKRVRQSTGAEKKPDISKRPKTSKGSRKCNGVLEQDTTPTPLPGYTEEGEDDWKPPPANKDAWDSKVQCVDTVIRENSDGELWGYLIWNEKNADGRFYRTKANLPTIYRAAPQRMLHFYEKHLVFSTNARDPAADEADGKDEKDV
ncbi:hypothetical protein OEA41_002399 [Lepraria neglecta]|uniref:Chromo domain-containing protein n=1 Tax=Lepraria neglecta TaxID=209136 RepID=A0AAD9ZEQ9_9LECA|nr:hypothetical protein OEA41_002399 [Lepraria neglecta]